MSNSSMMPPLTENYAAHQAMANVVGAVTLTWAAAENALAMAIALIDGEFGPVPGHPELPIALKKRLAYLKSALTREPRLEPIKDRGIRLAETFMALKDRRHELTHGIARQIHGNVFASVRFQIKGRVQTSTVTRITVEDVALFLGEVMALSDEAMTVAALIGRIVH